MNRPLAYVSIPLRGTVFQNLRTATKYCRMVYEAGYWPECPAIFYRYFLHHDIPRENGDLQEYCAQRVRRCDVLVVVGAPETEEMSRDIAAAQKYGIAATTLDGILTVRGYGKKNETEGKR